MNAGDGSAKQATAFREAEKRYQLHKDELIVFRNGRRRGKGFTVRPCDLSALIDVDAGSQPDVQPVDLAALPAAAAAAAAAADAVLPSHSCLPPCAAAYAFPACPGLLLVRNALSSEQQRSLVVDALTLFPEPPAHTNHTRALGGLPGLWAAAQAGLRLRLEQPSAAAAAAMNCGPEQQRQQQRSDGSCNGSSCSSSGVWAPDGTDPPATTLLRKLRWATLGPPYDWTAREYLRHEAHRPLPAQLQALAVELAALAEMLLGCDADAKQECEEEEQQQQQPVPALRPAFDAALVNYYPEGSTLGGHIDDAESDLTQSLVSLSLGCPAVFLAGGATRDVQPLALLLRSGDAMVMAGPARRAYHGVPRVFTDAAPAPALEVSTGNEWFAPFAAHMRSCRINISIRDTH